MGAWDGSIRLKDVELQGQRAPHRGGARAGGDGEAHGTRSASGAAATTSGRPDAPSAAAGPEDEDEDQDEDEDDAGEEESGLPSFAPFVLLSGRIGELVVTIPYMSFWRRHCKLAVTGLRIRVGPMDESHWGHEGSALRARAEKQAALVAEELRKMLQSELAGDAPDGVHERNNKVFQQMAILLLHSVEVVLEDTVVEYCDASGEVVGIAVGRVAVDNADGDAGGAPSASGPGPDDGAAASDAVGGPGLLISKDVEVRDVSVYVRPARWGPGDEGEAPEEEEWIGRAQAERCRVVDPFDARIRAAFLCDVVSGGKVDGGADARSPQQPRTGEAAADSPAPRAPGAGRDGAEGTQAGGASLPLRCAMLNVRVSDISAAVALEQIQCAKRIANGLEFLALRLRYGIHRPPAADSPASRAGSARRRALWRYAINATRAKVWRLRLYISREYVNSRCRRRNRYVQNYKLRLAHRNLLQKDVDYGPGARGAADGDEGAGKLQWFEQELLALEEELTVPDIMHFRSLAESEILHITQTDAKESKKSHKRCACRRGPPSRARAARRWG